MRRDKEIRTLTRQIGRFAAGVRFSDLPEPLVRMTRDCIIDWIGNAIAGSRQPLAPILYGVMSDLGGNPEATIIGRKLKSSAANAAMVNATFSHAIDFDDVHLASGIHATAPILAAVLAVAESRNATTQQIIEAFVAGHEVMARLGVAVGNEMFARNSHPTGTLGYFGATIAVARLLDLPSLDITNAIGIAGGQAGSFTQVRGTMSKPFFAGHSAHGGVLSAIMALHGFKSALDLFEGPQGLLATFGAKPSAYEELTRGLGDRWEMLNNSFKAYAACAMSHAMLDGLLDLRGDGIEIERVTEIRAHIMPFATEYLNKPAVNTGLAGKFSAQYCAAVALLDGEAQERQFTDERAGDPRIGDLMQRVKLVPCEGLTMESARVEIAYADGHVAHREITAVSGSPSRPFPWSTLTQKFMALVDGTLSKNAAIDIIEAMEHWPDVDLLKLLSSLRGPFHRRTLLQALKEGLGDQSPGILE